MEVKTIERPAAIQEVPKVPSQVDGILEICNIFEEVLSYHFR